MVYLLLSVVLVKWVMYLCTAYWLGTLTGTVAREKSTSAKITMFIATIAVLIAVLAGLDVFADKVISSIQGGK